MNASIFIVFLMKVLLVAFKPGPGALVHANVALRKGSRTAIQMALGTETGHAIIFSIIYFTASKYDQTLGRALFVISAAAGLYFLIVGLRMLVQIARSRQALSIERRDERLPYYVVGLFWAFSNPVNIAFYAGVLLPDLRVISASPAQYFILLATLVAVMFAAHLLFILTPAALMKSQASGKQKRLMMLTSALIFVVLGAWFFFDSMAKLAG